jgi:hypothetical protein
VLADARSEVLDLGRRTRLATPAQRVALTVRYGGCAFPGCGRPAAWTDEQHITPFAHGGLTDVAAMVLLCRSHHSAIHRGTWSLELIDGTDGSREIRFIRTGT